MGEAQCLAYRTDAKNEVNERTKASPIQRVICTENVYMDKVLNTPRKHLFVQKTDAENNFFYMGEFDVLEAHEAEKKNNRGVLKPICKLKFKMQTAVREDLLRYLQSGKTMEEK
jgi:hypothetical protein